MTSIPDDVLHREEVRRRVQRIARQPRPSRRKRYKCRWCGVVVEMSRPLLAHQAICPESPRVKKLQAALAAAAPKRKRGARS